MCSLRSIVLSIVSSSVHIMIKKYIMFLFFFFFLETQTVFTLLRSIDSIHLLIVYIETKLRQCNYLYCFTYFLMYRSDNIFLL